MRIELVKSGYLWMATWTQHFKTELIGLTATAKYPDQALDKLRSLTFDRMTKSSSPCH